MERLNKLKERLEKIGYTAKVFATGEEAKAYLLSAIPTTDTVGVGGSMTVQQLGLAEALRARGQQVSWHWGVPADQVAEMRRLASTADTYLCSANAILPDGRIVNIDGFGNRPGRHALRSQEGLHDRGRKQARRHPGRGHGPHQERLCPRNAKR